LIDALRPAVWEGAHFSLKGASMELMSEIVLRDYRREDLEEISRLDEACFAKEFRFDRRSMRGFVEAGNAVTVVAEEMGGGIAGFVIVHVQRIAGRVTGYVVTLDVAEESRKRGLASRMMQEVERRARAVGARRMELDVFTGNEGAIRFYERMGYERVGVRLGFYGAPGRDAFVYRKELAGL
jgi:ribosomal-protein-alanine N-acetyltransferase